MLEEQEDKDLARDTGYIKDDLTQGLHKGPEPKRPRLLSFLTKCRANVENQRGSEGSTVSVSLLLKLYIEERTQPYCSGPLLYWKEVPQSLNPLKNLARE
ncbi:hypothetical protein SK128_002362, partial [Halocaridina rubra]